MQLEGNAFVALQYARVIGRRIETGRGVEIASDAFDLLGDHARRPRFRTFERHVFEKVGQTMLVIALVARSDSNPNAEGNRLEIWHPMRRNADAIRKRRQIGCHDADPVEIWQFFRTKFCDTERLFGSVSKSFGVESSDTRDVPEVLVARR